MNFKFRKIFFIMGIIVASFMAYRGLSGDMPSLFGGLGWMLVTLYNFFNYINLKRDEKMFEEVMKAVEEDERMRRVQELSPQIKTKEN